jgi:glycosyltransferase involved in cell wall biosynthesis
MTHRLRIMHAIARLNVGGAALHVLQLAAEQHRRGHDVVVVAGSLAPGEESMEYLGEELGVEVVKLPALQRELSLPADARAVRTLRSLIRSQRPDVLHTHTAKAGATGRVAALLAGRARPRTLVHTYHGHVLSGYFSPRRERIFRAIERALARPTRTLVAVSEEVRDDLVRFGVAPHERFAVVPYGLELPEWSAADDQARARLRTDLGLSDSTFAIGWAGRLTAIKRPLDLIHTHRAVLDSGIDAVLVLVGDGELREQTEALARDLDVADRTFFVGFQRAIRDWYAATDAGLLTSANEGTPIVAIETLAAERPVVATAAGGVPSVVTEGETGFLLPVGDTAGLGARLAQLARDAKLREKLGTAGAADVRARFSLERMTDQLDAVYRR